MNLFFAAFLCFLSLATGATAQILTGADQVNSYLPLLKGKKVGIIANQTAEINGVHLVDSLKRSGVDIVRVFGPEHGFRGNASAGQRVHSDTDSETGIPVVSLYGKHKKPRPEELQDLDILIFDIQDVGARFYTYISTMSLAMEAAAEQGIPFWVLDRPNPNGHYVDGPVLEPSCSSFVGMHPVPVVHGMTVGEYAQMVKGEGWIKQSEALDLRVFACKNYTHSSFYELPVPPSPNLPNMTSIYLYPSVCFFEGTKVSVGRGTDLPFQWVGYPGLDGNLAKTPRSIPGVADKPKYQNQSCGGYDLRKFGMEYIRNLNGIYLLWLEDLYQRYEPKSEFFIASFFDKLMGNHWVREAIIKGTDLDTIRARWMPDVLAFKIIRKQYLIYPDFE